MVEQDLMEKKKEREKQKDLMWMMRKNDEGREQEDLRKFWFEGR